MKKDANFVFVKFNQNLIYFLEPSISGMRAWLCGSVAGATARISDLFLQI